ncbi:MAG: hypothetical protein QOJ05_699 [Verrucomicrobiota bacterium]|jgi:hypothetical protein
MISAFSMAKFYYLLFGLMAASGGLAAVAVDEDKPHGRVCVSLFEPGPPEKEELFQVSLPPGSGRTVRAYVDASEKCTVLVAALTKDGKLANGWRPQLSEVPGDFEEILLPKAPVKWDWSGASGPFDFYVLFLTADSKEIAEARKLVDAMQNPKVDDRVLALQTGKLKELIGRITSAQEKVNPAPASEPEVGGVFRGTAFPWRQFAQGANFAADHPGVLVLSSESVDKK